MGRGADMPIKHVSLMVITSENDFVFFFVSVVYSLLLKELAKLILIIFITQ